LGQSFESFIAFSASFKALRKKNTQSLEWHRTQGLICFHKKINEFLINPSATVDIMTDKILFFFFGFRGGNGVKT
jgi:hypothetical protein